MYPRISRITYAAESGIRDSTDVILRDSSWLNIFSFINF
jgi:hypothetical protein